MLSSVSSIDFFVYDIYIVFFLLYTIILQYTLKLEGNLMKSIKTAVANCLAVIAPLALALAIMTANSTCFVFTHQPTPPSCLAKYRKH